jgi:peptidoglycan/LPS O-acetylase OafA/YrhL
MKILPSILFYLSFVILLAIMPVAAQHNGYADWLVPNFWLIFFFLSGLTFFVLITILIVQQKNEEYYVQGFLAATTVKILACLVFIVVFLMKNKVNKYVFLADFFYIYLLNMVFEVYVLLRNLRHKNLR